MYEDEELDTVLEDAYDDGYYQALLDMDTYDDMVEEDVDMYDDYDYDEAMEGPAREYRRKMNAGKTPEEIHEERKYRNFHMLRDPRYFTHGRHTAAVWDDILPEKRKQDKKYRDKRVRRYDTDEGERMRDDVDRKYGEKAEKKVRDDYNARTRAQYDALKSKLQSSNLTAAQKRAVMEKFKARKMQEKSDADWRADYAGRSAEVRAGTLHTKQLVNRL